MRQIEKTRHESQGTRKTRKRKFLALPSLRSRSSLTGFPIQKKQINKRNPNKRKVKRKGTHTSKRDRNLMVIAIIYILSLLFIQNAFINLRNEVVQDLRVGSDRRYQMALFSPLISAFP